MNSNLICTLAIVSAGWVILGGCASADRQVNHPQTTTATQPSSAQPTIADMTATVVSDDEIALEFTARLHNPGDQTIELSAGTPCSVLRWVIASADKVVQQEPARVCAQVVVTDILPPRASVERPEKILLDRRKFDYNQRYHLRYRFWRHFGEYEFTLADLIPASAQ